jgi:hypothetical protein
MGGRDEEAGRKASLLLCKGMESAQNPRRLLAARNIY